MPHRSREVRVGLVVLAAIAVLAAGVFLIGDRHNLFHRKNYYYIQFTSAGGLKPGSPVQLNGVGVGTIDEVVLPRDPNERMIQIWVKIDSRYAGLIRGPQPPGRPAPPKGNLSPPSGARVKTLGLLGDKYIEISSGGPQYPVIPDEGEIQAAQPTDVDALLASGEDVMDNVVQISHSLQVVLGRLERGEGLIGELTSDSESSRRLRGSLVGTAESMQRIATRVETGQGPLPRLLNDRQMADRLAGSLDRLEGVLAAAQTGPGLLPGLLNDAATRAQLNDTLGTLNKVARDLHGFTADLEKRNGLLPRLVNDEEYGREVTGKVRDVVDNLDEVSRKLARGNGTAARLINDPQIYDAVKDILVGVNESRMLRWLIRNRQKKGIEKRYGETRKAIEGQGGTPPPDATEATPPASPPPGGS